MSRLEQSGEQQSNLLPISVSRIQMLGLLAATLIGQLAVTAPKETGAPVEAVKAHSDKVERLEVLDRYSFADPSSRAAGIRWASKNSLYVLFRNDGVSEVPLVKGLSGGRLLLPGRSQSQAIWSDQGAVAVADSVVVSADKAGQFVWSKIGEGKVSDAQRINIGLATVSAIDFDGKGLIMLGASAPLQEKFGKFVLWTGTLSASLDDFAPLETQDAPTSTGEWYRRVAYLGMDAGSIRLTPKGDILAFQGFGDEVLLYAKSGKVLHHWSLRELGLADEKREEMIASHVSRKRLREQLAEHGTVVDDVLVVGKTPAVVVRSLVGTRARWRLALLEAGELRLFEIPAPRWAGPATRVRADADSHGRIAFLFGDRDRSDGDQAKDQEILVAAAPY